MTPLQQKFQRLIRATGVFDDELYARLNPEVVDRFPDLLEHYIVAGEREGRAPNLFFEPNWYRRQTPRLTRQDCLLAHYLTVGDRDGLQPMPGFDPAHVRETLGARMEPALVGFLKAKADGRAIDPNRLFAYDWYLTSNPDVADAGVDGFWHFVHVGADEGRTPSAEFSWPQLREKYKLGGRNSEAWRTLMLRWRHLDALAQAGEAPTTLLMQDEIRANHRPSHDYEPHAAPPTTDARRGCDVYAFYLTQYHRVAENDAWWGEGFTEWHNVVRGVPRFSGHYQPRVPSALGFYDLDDPRIMPRQVALARQAGLAGFAFYYYHFGEQRLLERPLERFLADPSLDCGFFLIWANETWSRRWDGSETEVLLEQRYPDALPDRLAADLARHFADPRYRRIDGRPLLVIYRVGAIPDAPAWIERLRAAFAALGEQPLIYMAQSFGAVDPRVFGLDGAMEFPPHKLSTGLPLAPPARPFGANPTLKVWDYDDFVDAALGEAEPSFPLIRACFPSWDNDSRRQGASSVIHGSTPEKFRRWLGTLVEREEARSDGTGIVCVNAWNEWGEGAYLEPDRRFGYAYLNAVQRILHPAAEADARRRVLLVSHDAFPAGAQRIVLNMGRTLRQEMGADVLFLLLRADPGYDGLLDEFREAGDTVVASGDLSALARRLVAGGLRHAVVNSAASAAALGPLTAAGMSVVHLVHELPAMFAQVGAPEPVAAAARRVRRFIAPTPAIAAMLVEAGVPADRAIAIPQGQYRRVVRMDAAEARRDLLGGEGEGRVLVAGLGYGDRRKGLDLFVAAAEQALARGEAMLFLWQGGLDPGTAAALGPRMEALTAAGAFLHLPPSPEIDRLLAAADLFFLSSREDPLPSVAIEAWSTGLPVVALRGTGGIADMIAGDPALGALAEGEDAAGLLRALHAGLALGRSEARADWAVRTFDWPAYVRAILRELVAAPPVDVAIIGHNHGRFAETRIGSIVRQTLPARAVTYHDIASTDGSPAAVHAACRRLGVAFAPEPPNDGRLFRTWTAAARASDAEYLHLAEGDDWIAPAMLDRCVRALAAEPRAGFAFTAVEWVDEEDAHLADHRGYPPSVIGPAIAGGGYASSELMLGSEMLVRNPILSISSVVWRRRVLLDVLEANAAAFGELSFAYDWLLYLRTARAGHGAVFVPDPLCRHRQHRSSFAARDDLARHAAEAARLYALEPAPAATGDRDAYLATLA